MYIFHISFVKELEKKFSRISPGALERLIHCWFFHLSLYPRDASFGNHPCFQDIAQTPCKYRRVVWVIVGRRARWREKRGRGWKFWDVDGYIRCIQSFRYYARARARYRYIIFIIRQRRRVFGPAQWHSSFVSLCGAPSEEGSLDLRMWISISGCAYPSSPPFISTYPIGIRVSPTCSHVDTNFPSTIF